MVDEPEDFLIKYLRSVAIISQVKKSVDLVIYTKKDCCLCDRAKEVIRRVVMDYPVEMKEVDITLDEGLYSKYRRLIPVIFVDGQLAFLYSVAEADLRKKLNSILGTGR